MASASNISSSPEISNTGQFSRESVEESNKITAALDEMLENLRTPIEPSAMIGRKVEIKESSELGFSYSIVLLCNSLGNEYNELKNALINILNPCELNPASPVIIKELSTEGKYAVLKTLSESKFDLKSFIAQNENQHYYEIIFNLFKIYNQTDEFSPLERDISKINVMIKQRNQRSAVFKSLMDNNEIETALKVTKNLPEQEQAIIVFLDDLTMEDKHKDAISIAFKISDRNIIIKALQSILGILKMRYKDNENVVGACETLENYLFNCLTSRV